MYVDSHNEDMKSDDKFNEAVEEIDIACDSDNQEWLDHMERHSAISAVHISSKRRNLSVSHSKRRLQEKINFNSSKLAQYYVRMYQYINQSTHE